MKNKKMARSRFGALGAYAGPYTGLPHTPVLYTPLNETQTREPSEPQTQALKCPSVAKCESALGEDLFAHKDPRKVVRVGQPEQLERELEAYETLRSIAGDDFRALKAELVTPTGAPFDPPHLLIERYAPLGKVPVPKKRGPRGERVGPRVDARPHAHERSGARGHRQEQRRRRERPQGP